MNFDEEEVMALLAGFIKRIIDKRYAKRKRRFRVYDQFCEKSCKREFIGGGQDMTREEAVELLEKEKAYMIGHGGDRQAKALDMAIKSLEQESVSREVYDNEFALRKEFEIKAYKLQRQLEKAEHNIDKIKADIEHLEEGIIRMSKLAML